MHLGKPSLDRAPVDRPQSPRPEEDPARTARDLRDLLALAPGLLCEGRIVAPEWSRLATWAATHDAAMARWPIHLLFSRLQLAFTDGFLDAAERAELHELHADLVADPGVLRLGGHRPSVLPLDTPAGLVAWEGQTFVFTGRFAFGTVPQCAREVVARGGRVADRVTTLTTFLVVGSFTSRDRGETSDGRKMDDAIGLHRLGLSVRLVGEDQWTSALMSTLGTRGACRTP